MSIIHFPILAMKNWCFFGKLKNGLKPRYMWRGKKLYETILSFV